MKRIGILLCCIVLCLLFPEKVHAEEIVSEKEPVDIIFVIDCSGSMKTNDVSRMGLSMVQAFVDTVQAEDIRIGYVAYNDSILSYSAPKSIALAEEREALKEEIGAKTYSRDILPIIRSLYWGWDGNSHMPAGYIGIQGMWSIPGFIWRPSRVILCATRSRMAVG